jgi:hypothetical protein
MKPIELLKKNAPEVFEKYARQKILKLEEWLKDLRKKYKEETNEERKKQIMEEGKEVKQELEELKVLLQNEIPTDNNQ